MHFNQFPILAALLAMGVDALIPRSLLARQTDFGVCTTECDPFSADYSSCTTTACICTTAAATDLQTCVNCATLASSSVTITDDVTALVDTFSSLCAGTDIPTVTVGTGVLATTSTSFATASVVLPSVSFSAATVAASVVHTVVGPSSASATSASATPTASKAGGSGAIPGASTRNMLANVGIINVVGMMILGVMLVL